MAKEVSPQSSVEDLNQWELVDFETQPRQISSPQRSSTSIGVLVDENGQSQLLSNKDEEKDSILHRKSTTTNEDDEDDDVVHDLQEQYRQQQRLLQAEQTKCCQLTQEMQKTKLIAQNNSNNHAKQAEYERIIAENKKNLQQLEKQKEESQLVVDQLLQGNEEMKKKLDEICRQREQDKQRELKREKEFVEQLERNKEQHLHSTMEKELILKEKELLKKEKDLVKKEKDELLSLQQKQNQNNINNNKKDPIDCEVVMDWKCRLCGRNNGKSLRYCQSCNQSQHRTQNNGEILTITKILNERVWKPCEEEEYVWILQNQSDMPLNIKVKLERSRNGKEITMCEEGVLKTYEAKPKGEMNVIINVRAPPLSGAYNVSWQMVTQDKRKIGPVLEMKLVVKSDLKQEQEAKVQQMICDLGFTDRASVVAALTANKWDMGNATHDLLEQASAK